MILKANAGECSMILEQGNVHQSAIPSEEVFTAAAQADEKGQESHSEPGFF